MMCENSKCPRILGELAVAVLGWAGQRSAPLELAHLTDGLEVALWLQKFGGEEFMAKLLGLLRGRQRREAKEEEQWTREKEGEGGIERERE